MLLTCDEWRAVVRWLPVVATRHAASTCRSAALAARREVIERVVDMRARFLAALDDDIGRTRACRIVAMGYLQYDVVGSSVHVKRRLRRIMAAWSAMVIERGDARRPIEISHRRVDLQQRFHYFALQASLRHRGRTVVCVTMECPWNTPPKTWHRWGDEMTATRKLSQLYDDALDASYGFDDADVITSRLIVQDDDTWEPANNMLDNVSSLLAHVRRAAVADDMNRVARDVTLDGYQAQLDAALDECAWLCNHCRNEALKFVSVHVE